MSAEAFRCHGHALVDWIADIPDWTSASPCVFAWARPPPRSAMWRRRGSRSGRLLRIR